MGRRRKSTEDSAPELCLLGRGCWSGPTLRLSRNLQSATTEPTGAGEPQLALTEQADVVPGWPQWIAPGLRLIRGLDPLGLQTITQDRIMPLLLPGVLVLSQRARLFSLYPFLVAEY